MTVTTIYPSYDGDVTVNTLQSATTWAAYQALTTGYAMTSTLTSCSVYTRKLSTTYDGSEAFEEFDTSSITGLVSSATLSLYASSIGSPGITANALIYDWGADPVTISDWPTYSEISAMGTPVAALTMTSTGLKTSASTSGLCTYVQDHNTSKLWLTTSNRVNNIDPGVNSAYATFSSADSSTNKPYLTVTWAPLVTGTAAASLTSTATATGLRTVLGASVAALTSTQTATGTPTVLGASAASLTSTATATGLRTVFGMVSADLTMQGAVVGGVEVTGTATASLAVQDTVIGTRETAGSASTELVGTATGTGSVVSIGTANASLSVTAHAFVSYSDLFGTGTATLTLSAHASTDMLIYTNAFSAGGTQETVDLGNVTGDARLGTTQVTVAGYRTRS